MADSLSDDELDTNAMASTNETLKLAQNIITITFGGSLFVCNAFAGSLIFYAMRRKSTTFVLVAAMLAADAIYGMAYILNATYSLSLVGMDVTVTRTRFFCAIRPNMILSIWSMPLIALMPLSLSIERLVAVFAPFRYRSMGNLLSYALIVNAITVATTWLLIVIFVLDPPEGAQTTLECAMQSVFGLTGRRAVSLFRIIMTSLGVIGYIPVIWRMTRPVIGINSYPSSPKLSSNNKPINSSRQLQAKRLNRSAFLNVLNTLIFFNVPDIFFFIFGQNLPYATMFTTPMLCSRGLVSTAIFFIGHRELRETLRRRIFNKSSTVANVTVMPTWTRMYNNNESSYQS